MEDATIQGKHKVPPNGGRSIPIRLWHRAARKQIRLAWNHHQFKIFWKVGKNMYIFVCLYHTWVCHSKQIVPQKNWRGPRKSILIVVSPKLDEAITLYWRDDFMVSAGFRQDYWSCPNNAVFEDNLSVPNHHPLSVQNSYGSRQPVMIRSSFPKWNGALTMETPSTREPPVFPSRLSLVSMAYLDSNRPARDGTWRGSLHHL